MRISKGQIASILCCAFWFVAACIFAGVFGWAYARPLDTACIEIQLLPNTSSDDAMGYFQNGKECVIRDRVPPQCRDYMRELPDCPTRRRILHGDGGAESFSVPFTFTGGNSPQSTFCNIRTTCRITGPSGPDYGAELSTTYEGLYTVDYRDGSFDCIQWDQLAIDQSLIFGQPQVLEGCGGIQTYNNILNVYNLNFTCTSGSWKPYLGGYFCL
jgi:hypothetical protein